MNITDAYGRTFKTLRVSLLNACNLACTYCVSEDKSSNKTTDNSTPLHYTQLAHIVNTLHHRLNLSTIRLTGGEPTLYKDLALFIGLIAPLGVDIKLTTNGYLLHQFLSKLDKYMLKSINISLDALDEDVFFQISKRRHLSRILQSIDLAQDMGIEIKLNCVMIKGINEHQIIPLLEYAFKKNITIRFLEMMKMGHLHHAPQEYVSEFEILEIISKKYSFKKNIRAKSSTANYWTTAEGHRFGIIANESAPFCSDCDRLRLDSFGKLYGCLSSSQSIDISSIDISQQAALDQALSNALRMKQVSRFEGSTLSMLHVGG